MSFTREATVTTVGNTRDVYSDIVCNVPGNIHVNI